MLKALHIIHHNRPQAHNSLQHMETMVDQPVTAQSSFTFQTALRILRFLERGGGNVMKEDKKRRIKERNVVSREKRKGQK